MASDGVGKRAGGSCLQGFVEFEGGFYSKFSSRSIFSVLEMWWWGFWKDQRPDWLGSRTYALWWAWPAPLLLHLLALPFLHWGAERGRFFQETEELGHFGHCQQRPLKESEMAQEADSGKRVETHGDNICVTWSHSPESHWCSNSVSVFSPTSGSSKSPEERELQNSSLKVAFLEDLGFSEPVLLH